MARKKHDSFPAYADDFIGPREPHMLTLLPFPGFYNSILSSEIESHEEREAEYMAGNDDGDNGADRAVAKHLRLDAGEYAELLSRHCDYHKLNGMLARSYCDAFDYVMSDHLGIDVGGLKYESMDSPAYYNFETDRLFAHIPVRVARRLVRLALANRKQLRQVISDRHESRSGFHSWYSADLSDWADMFRRFLRGDDSALDHNQMQTVIMAAFPASDDPDLEIYYRWTDCDGICHEYDSALNWAAFKADVAELRAEKQAEYEAELTTIGHPIPPARDPNTPDMFEGN